MTTLAPSRSSRNPQFSENPVSYRRNRRRNDLNLPPAVYCTQKRLRRAIAVSEGCCDWPTRKLAAHCGVSEPTFYRHAAIIVANRILSRTSRPGRGRLNDTSLWTLPDVTIVIPTRYTPAPTLKNEREKQVLINTTTKATTPPNPPEGERGVVRSRETRRVRNRERRQAHYREVQERRERHRCSAQTPLTAVEQAAAHVMACIGEKPSMRLTRAAIVESLEAWMAKNPDRGWTAGVNAMVRAWKEYFYFNLPLKFRFKPIGFFGGNHWKSDAGWGIDEREIERCMAASVGSNEPPPRRIDTAALRAKIEALTLEHCTEDEGDE